MAALSLAGCGGDCEEPGWADCEVDADCTVVECGCCYDGGYGAVREECQDAWRQAHGCEEGLICLALYCEQRMAACEAGRCVVR